MTHVELHVPGFEPVKQFYGALGFEVVREEVAPGHGGYLVMQLGEAVISFWPGNESVATHSYFQRFGHETPRGYGVEIVVMVDDIDDVHERASKLDAVVVGLKDRPWGVRDFRVADPYGYYIRFTEPIALSR